MVLGAYFFFFDFGVVQLQHAFTEGLSMSGLMLLYAFQTLHVE